MFALDILGVECHRQTVPFGRKARLRSAKREESREREWLQSDGRDNDWPGDLTPRSDRRKLIVAVNVNAR